MASVPDVQIFSSGSCTFYHIGAKGHCTPVKVSIDNQNFILKLEKLSLSSTSNISPLANLAKHNSETGLRKLQKFKVFRKSNPTLNGYSKFSNSINSSIRTRTGLSALEQIPVLEIANLCVSDFPPKLALINTDALKQIKNLGGGGNRRSQVNKLRILEIDYGKEFNFKRLQFLVINVPSLESRKGKENFDELEEFLEHVWNLKEKYRTMGYFDKSRLWYQQQFKEMGNTTVNDSLKVWKNFLLQEDLPFISDNPNQVKFSYLESLLQQPRKLSEKCESDLICNYFIDACKITATIFAQFDNEMESPNFENIFANYFAYVATHGRRLLPIPRQMDGATETTQQVIRSFAEKFHKENLDKLICEKWLCSYYLLDYLFSAENTIWSAETTQVYQDMNQPLSHYWIASSHNTYLTGDQYSSPSSVEAYARVLREGCRCIEIDVWNGPGNKPIVKHGRTLTASVKLKDVLETIKANAFVTSTYPLILSIENHCNLRQQKTMAKYLRKIFGKMLVTQRLDPQQEIQKLPSPEHLKNRVIIKGRKLPATDSSSVSCDDVSLDDRNPCDCLITGELYFSGENEQWTPNLFVLTNKKLFYLEKCESLKTPPGPPKPAKSSMTSLDSNQEYYPPVSKTVLVTPTNFSRTHEKEEWFYSHADRCEAEKILERLPVTGAFLARYRTGSCSDIVVSFRYENIIKHCQIKREGEQLTVSNLKFDTLETLVRHYYTHAFYKSVRLKYFVGRNSMESALNNPRAYGCSGYLNSTVKTISGRVRAIQSFNTLEPGLLSFKKGDIIVNVLKESDGWWWGTKENAIGDESHHLKQFPESFVEDLEEIEECDFVGYSCKGTTWNLGTSVKVKPCKDKLQNELGIKYYLSFKYLQEPKKRLGATCSRRGANEWADLINYVISNDQDGKNKMAMTMAANKYKIASEFSNLIVYCCAMTGQLNPDNYNRDRINVCNIKSFDELGADRLFRSNVGFFEWYHQHALTRVYPKSLRLDSSNFSPVRYWNFGCQMVALNYQTPDKAMQWNRGKFRQNGSCGYVLKPKYMVPEEQEDSEEGQPDTLLTIQVISARHLEKIGSWQVSPTVELQVIGAEPDCRKIKSKANRSSWQKCMKPTWNSDPIHLKLTQPELALVQFSVYDVESPADRNFLGEATIPFPCLRTGYRSIQLNNAHGFPLLSTLLVFSTINDQNTKANCSA